MRLIRILISKAAAGLLLGSAALANATPITWTFSNVAFDDGTQLLGQFSYDATTDSLLSYSISVSNGTLPALNYNVVDSYLYAPITAGYWGANELVIAANDNSTYLAFNFASVLSDAGGVVALLNDSTNSDPLTQASWESAGDGSAIRYVTQGAIAAQSVPEPSSLALCGLGGLGLLFALRRKKA